jgi:hypothetical protein
MDEPPALDPRGERFTDPADRTGGGASPADPGGGGLSTDREREERLAAIRAAVEQSLEDVKAGRVADQDAALDRIEKMLDEIEAAKRG